MTQHMRKFYFAGNWKMNLKLKEALALVKSIKLNITASEKFNPDKVALLVAPPFTTLYQIINELGKSQVKVAAQNCHYEESGAFTGEVSASMLQDIGVDYCIIGHSERRQLFLENDEFITKKVISVLKSGLMPILCVGETKAQRDQNQHFQVIDNQLKFVYQSLTAEDRLKVIIAYEPVWAIGTGQTALATQVDQMHQHIRKFLFAVGGSNLANKGCILYGGSVKPSNAKELSLVADVDGFLIGGASLQFDDFYGIFDNAVI